MNSRIVEFPTSHALDWQSEIIAEEGVSVESSDVMRENVNC